MDRTAAIEPMSDRRTVVAVLGLLAAAIGVVVVVLAAVALRQPVGSSGELGTPTDFTDLLVDLLWAGGALVVVGAGTAIALVRAQLR